MPHISPQANSRCILGALLGHAHQVCGYFVKIWHWIYAICRTREGILKKSGEETNGKNQRQDIGEAIAMQSSRNSCAQGDQHYLRLCITLTSLCRNCTNCILLIANQASRDELLCIAIQETSAYNRTAEPAESIV